MNDLERLDGWPVPFDADVELDWGDPIFSRRLLREHLDPAHDGATRRPHIVRQHLRRLSTLLSPAPQNILDAACGPGLYVVGLAEAGHEVTGIDAGPAVIRHARTLARERRVGDRARFLERRLETLDLGAEFEAITLIYHVLEGFPRRSQPAILRRLAAHLAPNGRVVVEMRTRVDQPPGRVNGWEVADFSLLSDRPHLLLSDSWWDDRSRVYVLRETAVLPTGIATVQTTSALTELGKIDALFARGGLSVVATYDGWTRHPANALSSSLLVVARRR